MLFLTFSPLKLGTLLTALNFLPGKIKITLGHLNCNFGWEPCNLECVDAVKFLKDVFEKEESFFRFYNQFLTFNIFPLIENGKGKLKHMEQSIRCL